MSGEERLDQLLDVWQVAAANGQFLDPFDLCRDCPEIANELTEEVAILQRFRRLGVSDAVSGEAEVTIADQPQFADDTRSFELARSSARATSFEPRLPSVGEVFAGFRLLAIIGEGGFGVVYRADDPALQRKIAIKVLHPRE